MPLQKIIIENIQIHTNHGCMDEEGLIGSEYTVDIEVHADMLKSAQSDNLSDTVDYVHLNKIVHQEMRKRSKLLETVALRILNRVGAEIPMIKFAEVKVSKLNPPMGGNVEKVSVIFNQTYH
ncbi:dihydroneopterin aldolase [Flavobacteriaceae bacterium Ap0902]|nr:dihydroneopterin aldolase [Flavobacteriaceae bacterium Ap0902]